MTTKSIESSPMEDPYASYPFDVIEAFVNFVGGALEFNEDLRDPLRRQFPCEMPLTIEHSLEGITNGEIIYACVSLFEKLMEDGQDRLSMFEIVLLKAIAGALRDEFMGFLDDAEYDIDDDANAVCKLYEFCCAKLEKDGWKARGGRPPYCEISSAEWENIFRTITDEFTPNETPEETFTHFTEWREQPHFPNFQETRAAIYRLLDLFGETETNRK